MHEDGLWVKGLRFQWIVFGEVLVMPLCLGKVQNELPPGTGKFSSISRETVAAGPPVSFSSAASPAVVEAVAGLGEPAGFPSTEISRFDDRVPWTGEDRGGGQSG
jgi:hypothetical protein